MTQPQAAKGFNARWESDVYAEGRQMNRYPFPCYIGPFFGHFGRVADRKSVEVLEIGCGAGNNIWFFAREGFSIHGIEGSASALAYARKRLDSEELKADLREGDFQHLPYGDASMDFVLDRGSITHNRRAVVEATLDEARRVLKPGGLFYSQMFTTGHTDLQFGTALGDGSAEVFTEGYFAGIGLTFFASRADIDTLFGSRFELLSVEIESLENVLTGHKSTVWNVLGRKNGA